MKTKNVKTETELLMNLRFMKLDLDVDIEEQDMFADLAQFAKDMLLKRQLNSSGLIGGGS